MSTSTLNNSSAESFTQAVDHFRELYGNHLPAQKSLQSDAAAVFSQLGIPTTKHEEWKYTSLAVLSKNSYRTVNPSDNCSLSVADVASLALTNDTLLYVIENGKLNTAASNANALPKGVTIGSLADLANDPRVQAHLMKHADFADEALVALNTALTFDGVVIMADAKTELASPIQIAVVNNTSTEALNIPVRILVIAEKNTNITVTETHHSFGAKLPVLLNVVSEVVIAEQARVNYVKLQAEDQNTCQVNYHKVNMARDSYQHISTLSWGGGLVRNNLNIRLDDVNCTSYLNGLTIAKDYQVIDHHTVVDHAMPNCYSNELYKGIIDGHAQGVFNGKIFVRKDAQKTNAFQSNKNVLLSDDASMNAKPQLEIFADDVKCSHGATTGQIDEEALFYLRARGIGEVAARALLNHAFAADVIEQIPNEHLKSALLDRLTARLNA
jgi:Fe-S cluster assembly protein SufD